MKFERERWTPLTITIETPEEAEVLHKILAGVDNDSSIIEYVDLYGLFLKLGEGLTTNKFEASGSVTIKEA